MLLAQHSLFLLASLIPQDQADQATPEQRYEALTFLVSELRSMHPDPFFGIDEEEFTTSQYALEDRLGDVDDDQFAVGLMRLVTSLSYEGGRDGHAVVMPTGRWSNAPLRVYAFADGWFVTAALKPHEDLVGAKVISIGGVPVEEVAERVAPLIPRDNLHDLRAKLPNRMFQPELLHALGIGENREQIALGLVIDGEERKVTLDGVPRTAVRALSAGLRSPFLPTGDELWLSDPGSAWWMRTLDEERALYAQYNVVQTSDSTVGSLGDFAAALVGTFEEGAFDRVVLDVRLNGGGDNTTFGPLIDAIRGSQAMNQRGRLYGLMGRHTFSAAGNFITVLQRDTNSILVGEPTGGAPSQYGDARSVSLPHHPWLLVRLATRYHVFGGADDERLTHEPDLPVAYTSEDYFTGRDPVLRVALEHEAE